MTHRLTTNYAKNYCNWTLIVKVIVENVVTCFFWDTVYVGSVQTAKVGLSQSITKMLVHSSFITNLYLCVFMLFLTVTVCHILI